MAKAPKNHGKPWTKGDINELKGLAKQNTPTRVIGLKTVALLVQWQVQHQQTISV
jgi:hypothetical protein